MPSSSLTTFVCPCYSTSVLSSHIKSIYLLLWVLFESAFLLHVQRLFVGHQVSYHSCPLLLPLHLCSLHIPVYISILYIRILYIEKILTTKPNPRLRVTSLIAPNLRKFFFSSSSVMSFGNLVTKI